MSSHEILLVDDEKDIRQPLAHNLERVGFQVHQADNVKDALVQLDKHDIACAIVDHYMPEATGLEFLETLQKLGHDCGVIMMSGQSTVPLAVEAMKKGAVDFLTKPVRLPVLQAAIERQINHQRLYRENAHLKELLRQQRQSTQLIGQSQVMMELERLIARMGRTKMPILIQGESGTGKELVARSLVERSEVSEQPLVTINCAALPEHLLESELFGHEKGSFTGATVAKPGLFEVADGGTLFIDEIGELAPSLQPKLLRVLEDGSLRRVGSIKERKVTVRLIAATNRDLALEVKQGRFREDLFYRINMLTIQMPPLRDRGKDIVQLVQHFVGAGWQLAEGVIDTLQQYDWPGNVRQLRNAIDRAKVLADENVIELRNFPREIVEANQPGTGESAQETQALSTMTKQHLIDAMLRARNNKSHAAKALGVTRRSLYRLLEKYGIGIK